MIEAICRRVLDGQKLARVGVILDVAVGPDQHFIAGDKTATPARHVKALAGGMKFEADILRAGR